MNAKGYCYFRLPCSDMYNCMYLLTLTYFLSVDHLSLCFVDTHTHTAPMRFVLPWKDGTERTGGDELLRPLTGGM